MEDYRRHSCSDGSHVHLSFSEVAAHEKKNIVVWLFRAATRREKDVVQIQELAVRDDSWAGRPSSSRAIAGEAMNGGLSFRVGEYLAKRVRQREGWAAVMLSDIRTRPLRETEARENETDDFREANV